jgi:predicted flap endonuclease-1-like 5' DNA nuclease
VHNIKMPAAQSVDLAPVHKRIDDIERAVKGIQIPQPRDVNLQPMQERLAALNTAVHAIKIPQPQPVDLSSIQTRLSTVEELLRNLRMPTIPPQVPVDLMPTQQRLDALERAVRGIVIPPSTQVDLTAVLQKLSAIESRAMQPAPAPAPIAAPARTNPAVRAGSRNLLSRAAYGIPDDLKKIKGVAGVMEKMMHDIGVYYFWQIAEWSAKDVDHADAQLTAFHGRIARDEWVTQAVTFARQPESARKPTDM